MENKEKDLEYYNVPTYIEKAVKKLFGINSPSKLMQDEVDPNQMQLDI